MFATTITVILLLTYVSNIECSMKARAWQSQEQLTLPEDSIGEEKESSSGISFSGGGSRAFIGAIGVLSGLNQLSVIDKVKYTAGISGGSWATVAYTFSQLQVDDVTLLGSVIQPSDISEANMRIMDANCLRGLTAVNFTEAVDILHENDPALSQFELWLAAVSQIYLEPVGIARGKPFTWNQKTLEGILERNPAFIESKVDFLLPRSELNFGKNDETVVDRRPLPILAWTMIGPASLAPFTTTNRNYSLVESTPIATGVLHTRGEVLFESVSAPDASLRVMTGGLVESFAYSYCCSPTLPMPHNLTTSVLEIPTTCGACTPMALSPAATHQAPAFHNLSSITSLPPSHHQTFHLPINTTLDFFDLASVAGASSYYVGCLAASEDDPQYLEFRGKEEYWSPLARTPLAPGPLPTTVLVGDGGGLQIDNLASLIQRGVKHAVLFCLTSTPLQPTSQWDPASTTVPLSQLSIDFTLPAFFGIVAEDMPAETLAYYDLSNHQLFPKESFVPLALALQAAQTQGTGIIVTTPLITVANSFYGIPAGLAVNVTWSYLGRLSAWEQQLSPEMKNLVVPATNAENLANLIPDGPFALFPNYPTNGADIDNSQSNLLANLVGWSVLQNKEHFDF